VLVAEAAPGAEARKSRFLVRNRLIAAMTRGTVVVEAARRSGSLNTARWALDIGRPVMGVPGPVTSTMSAGVHELLRQPGSLLVTDADQVIEHVSEIGFGLTASPVPP
jgi:DNA processing protein